MFLLYISDLLILCICTIVLWDIRMAMCILTCISSVFLFSNILCVSFFCLNVHIQVKYMMVYCYFIQCL